MVSWKVVPALSPADSSHKGTHHGEQEGRSEKGIVGGGDRGESSRMRRD